MFDSIQIKNFRGFKELKLENFQNINLFTGKNNVGKTALLEAIFLDIGAPKIDLTLNLNVTRGIDKIKVPQVGLEESAWDSFFYNFDTNNEIVICSKKVINTQIFEEETRFELISNQMEPQTTLDNEFILNPKFQRGKSSIISTDSFEEAKTLKITFKRGHNKKPEVFFMKIGSMGPEVTPKLPNPHLAGYYIPSGTRISYNEIAEYYSRIFIKKQTKILVEALKIIEPLLTDINLVYYSGNPTLMATLQNNNHLIPLQLMGEGTSRLANFIIFIISSKNGIVLIDEIENGIHHSILPQVWKVIQKAAKISNTQVFATTHSYECIMAAGETFSEMNSSDFKLYRLERINSKITSKSYTAENLIKAKKLGLEVR